jgi:hypothetical protein
MVGALVEGHVGMAHPEIVVRPLTPPVASPLLRITTLLDKALVKNLYTHLTLPLPFPTNTPPLHPAQTPPPLVPCLDNRVLVTPDTLSWATWVGNGSNCGVV